MDKGDVQMRLLALFFFVLFACVPVRSQTTSERQENRAGLEQLQNEIEMLRIEAETDRVRMQTDRMQIQMERFIADGANEPRQKDINEILSEYQAEKTAKEAADKAAANQKEETDRAAARSADSIYLSVAIALPLAFGFLIARRAKTNGGNMKHGEKIGILLMISALLLGLLVIVISDNWTPRLDALQNLMMSLRIRLIPESESPYSEAMIDIYTKYVLLGLTALAAYGFTTYLGITPTWRNVVAIPDELVAPSKEV